MPSRPMFSTPVLSLTNSPVEANNSGVARRTVAASKAASKGPMVTHSGGDGVGVRAFRSFLHPCQRGGRRGASLGLFGGIDARGREAFEQEPGAGHQKDDQPLGDQH